MSAYCTLQTSKIASGVTLQNWLCSRTDPSTQITRSGPAGLPPIGSNATGWLQAACLIHFGGKFTFGNPSLRSEPHKPPKSQAATFQIFLCFALHSSNSSTSRTKREHKDYGRPEVNQRLNRCSIPGSLPSPASSKQGAASWHSAPLPLCILLPRLCASCDHRGCPSV